MKKVLVVDDNKNIADLTEIILSSAGYSCTKLNDGKSCLDAVRGSGNNNKNNNNDDGDNNNSDGKNYDLILLDVAMPTFSGIDVMHALKQKGLLGGQKIVFFTASSSGLAAEPKNLEELGVLDCIRKPFSKTFLLEKIEQWLLLPPPSSSSSSSL